MADTVEPFRIEVPEEVLADLRRRIARTRWTDQLPGTGWLMGTDETYLRELVAYWLDGFDWRAQEADLNRFPQYTTSVDGQRLHFVHRRSPRPDARTLVLLHGWPSTFAELRKVIDPLADPDAHGAPGAPAFHVVAPSLPGYAFSGPTTRKGWTPHRMAGAVADLMARLGAERYGAQGGDWGSMVATQLAYVDPRVEGIHLNMVVVPKPRDGDPMAGVTEQEQADLAAMYARGADQRGYQEIQGTRPHSLSVALNDSPVGLAAWIVEKFHAWGDCGGDIESRFTKDELLTTVMLYWVTGTIQSANRLYRETRLSGRGASAPDRPVPVPMAHLRFPREGFMFPRAWIERFYDVARWTEHPTGGHFAAMEEPDALVVDVRAFFGGLPASTVGGSA
jgi:microsomal epoxide hydrolase